MAENNFGERKLSCTRLNFGEILFAGTKRAVSPHLTRLGSQSEHRIRRILPARGACLIIIPTYETVFDVMFSCLTFLPFSFLTVVNIFDIIAAIEIIKLPGGQILLKNRRDVCTKPDDRCTILAGG